MGGGVVGGGDDTGVAHQAASKNCNGGNGGGKGLTMGMFAELHTYQSVSWGLPSLLGARLVQHVWTTPPP